MASSQVEVASSSPFGSVLKEHNRGDRCRETNARAAVFQKNLKELVRDHFQNCVSVSADENSQNQDNKIDSWVGVEQGNHLLHHHHHGNLRFFTNNHTKNNEKERNANDSVVTSSKQSRILDRWAARQAREMVSTIEKQSQEAELLASSSETTSSSNRENSQNFPAQSDSRASSLVQIWEARVNRSNSISRTSSGISNTEEPSRGSEMGNSVNESCDDQSNHKDSIADWTETSSTLSQGRNSDAGDSERVRVADIIKRLTSGNDDNDNEMVCNANESPSRERRNSTDQAEQRGFPMVVNSPKIRGRQAFADLLMQLERDRHRELDSLVERRAVSRFTHRGRIQSMLRLKVLQRGHAIQDQVRRPQSAPSPLNRLPQGSTILHLREKFSTGVEHGATAQSDATTSRSFHTEVANSSTTNQRLSEDSRHQETSSVGRKSGATTENSVLQTSKDKNKEESSSRTNVEALYLESQVTDVAEDQAYLNSEDNSNENVMADEQQEANDPQQLRLGSQETAETTASLNDWDEELEETYEQTHFLESNYDWISEISRPRSYWEDRRQAWYQEMLSNRSENEEIRQLLERRRVSSFLASDFRETMDQLMTSRMERQIDLEGCENEEQDEFSRERIGQLLLSHLQRHLHPAVSQEEEQAGEGGQEEQELEEEEENDYNEEDEEEEEEGESPISHQDHEATDYFDQSSQSMQIPSSSTMRSWSYRDHEVGDYHSDPVGPASSPQPYYQDSRLSSSSTNRLSNEMELIYDLRGQMVQLHREMSELRKSIQSCMDRQVKFPPPQPQEVHSVGGTLKKRSCCICYEMQVDSLLYRCGHMCTCLKCAHELQWSCGKCPICRAPIVDVVRAYMDP